MDINPELDKNTISVVRLSVQRILIVISLFY